MAEKLAESTWSAFKKSKKLEVDDKALVKALTAFDKVDESKPAARLDALLEVIEQINKQVVLLAREKKTLGDKPFTEAKDKLHGLLDAAESLQKSVAAEKAKADKAARDSGDEEEDSPVLLTKKMVPLIRELKKGDARMHAMVCTAGKNTAVLIMRRPISASQRKLLAIAVDAAGGMKYGAGECIWEANALTFVMETAAAGLAKRLRAALQAQTELRLKVRVRGPDGSDEDGENEGDDATAAAAPGATAAAPAANPPAAPPVPSPEQLSYLQRLRRLQDPYDQALRSQHPAATRLRALMGFASEKADGQQNYAAAIQALQALEATLNALAPAEAPTASPGTAPAAATASTARPADTTVDAGTAFKARLTALLPRMKEVIAAAGPSAPEIKAKVTEAGAAATKKDFATANSLLDEAEVLMAGPVSGSAPAGWSPQRVDEVEARYLTVLKTQPANASDLRAAMAAVNDAIDKDDLSRAASALARLEALLAVAAGLGRETDVIPEGIVARRKASFEKAQVRWEAGVSYARKSVRPVQDGLPADFADLGPAIDNILDNYRLELAGLLAEVQAVPDAQAADSATGRLRAKLQSLRSLVAGEQLFSYLDSHGAPVSPAFTEALDEIQTLIEA